MHKVFEYYYDLQEELAERKIVNKILAIEAFIVTALFSLVCLVVNLGVSASDQIRIALIVVSLIAINAVFLVSSFLIAISNYMNEANDRIAEYIAGIAIARGLVVGKRGISD